jgi:hypothetical protein
MKAADAPAPPRKMTAQTQEILAAIQGLKADEVLKVDVGEGQSARGLKVTFGRVASNNNIKIQSWNTDDSAIYVQRK